MVVDEQDAGHRGLHRQIGADHGSRRGARDRQLPADLFGALTHRCQPEAVDARPPGQADPVVLDLQRQARRGCRAGARRPDVRRRVGSRWRAPRRRSGSTRPPLRPAATPCTSTSTSIAVPGVAIRCARPRMLPSSPRSSSTAGRRSSVMARTSSTAVATPVAADWSRPLATGSVTRSRAVSTCRRTPASAAPTPSCRSRRSRRRSSSRAVTIAARLCWSRSESRSAATAGATWSQTMASSSASRVGRLVSPGGR